MIQRLDDALAVLQQRIRDNRWTADDRLSQQYHDIGNQAQAKGDLLEAFRAHCRAMLGLDGSDPPAARQSGIVQAALGLVGMPPGVKGV